MLFTPAITGRPASRHFADITNALTITAPAAVTSSSVTVRAAIGNSRASFAEVSLATVVNGDPAFTSGPFAIEDGAPTIVWTFGGVPQTVPSYHVRVDYWVDPTRKSSVSRTVPVTGYVPDTTGPTSPTTGGHGEGWDDSDPWNDAEAWHG